MPRGVGRLSRGNPKMAREVRTFLMFEGAAEEALNLYVSLFAGSEVTSVERYGPSEGGTEGQLKLARFRLAGHELVCFNSPAPHAFTFTPSVSLFVECEDEAELDRAFETLSAGGGVLMPPGGYGFSTKFTWLNDRFGVSWQLTLK
jgi:predicted 3-demethylubiquinone-9 3-methyltransferase (glyoxalase superfamily)